ncbi:sodium-dependent transporter [Halogeometricum borinquense]|uniref:Sodium-dependent transporter n=1 Tax=Halogeometricum borinquense TaxID=60847 RepID=A0A6C0UHL0_9EURY|nr:sodium-dependent transporter [Halogeometricum borinquense]QIB74996.1 sodium-dependent transporter [Halogeometricum borinquense]QIQ76026.1 sodium-dependent transporter [Halogeometricum borinquense]
MTRETWATRAGFILAAVGSAVGLGNIWRFPWITAENGGSAFLAVYLGIVLLVGVPGLLGMFVIGRRAKRNPVGALRSLSGSNRWGFAGGFLIFSSLVLISFYSVVGGWILRYFGESVVGLVTGNVRYFANPGAAFGAASAGLDAVAFHLVFLALAAVIIVAGIRGGIEIATKWMMPAIFTLLVGLGIWASTQSGAAEAYAFYLRFDVSTLQNNFFGLLGPAAGQALFTLSLGVGTMITYASYLDEDRSLPFDGATIAVLNTIVGVLAGLVVFPLLFTLGIEPGQTGTGAGALFVGLAGAFAQLPGGTLVATAFFAVVALAALSSAISILEISVSFLVDEYGLARRRAAGLVGGLVAVTGSVCALEPSVFGFVAGTLVDILLTIGLAVCLVFVGWVMGRDAITEFRNGAGSIGQTIATPWLFGVGVLLPIFLVFTLLTTFGVDGKIGFWPTVVAAVAVAIAAFVSLRSERSVV